MTARWERLSTLGASIFSLAAAIACAAPVDDDAASAPNGSAGTVSSPPVQNGGANEATGLGSGGASSGGQSSTGGSGSASGGTGGGGGSAGEPLEPGLSAFYTFEDSGTTVTDDSGHGHDGSVVGSGVALGQSGKVGNGLSFSGLDGRVVIPTSSDLEFTKGATIEFWVKLQSMAGGTILSRVSANGDGLRVRTAEGNIQVFFIRSGGGSAVVSSDSGVLGSTWKHVAIVNDGTELRLLVDGKVIRTSVGGQLGSVGADLVLGKSSSTDNALNGAIDELKWWTVARKNEEVCSDAGGTSSAFGCTL